MIKLGLITIRTLIIVILLGAAVSTYVTYAEIPDSYTKEELNKTVTTKEKAQRSMDGSSHFSGRPLHGAQVG